MASGPQPRIVKFGAFEVDLRSGELRKAGIRRAFQEQPLRVLTALLERPGTVVSREELRRRLWPDGTFVDYEHSLNAAVRRLRTAIDDTADVPRFVETLHRRGYRFVAPVDKFAEDERGGRFVVALSPSDRARVAVLPFARLGEEPPQDFFSDGLTDETIAQLARHSPPAIGVIASTSVRLVECRGKSMAEIGRTLRADYVLEGSVRRAGRRVRVAAQLVDAGDETHAWAEVYDRELGDSLAVQTEIAWLIARAVSTRLDEELQARRQVG
jgi:TolB-like protein